MVDKTDFMIAGSKALRDFEHERKLDYSIDDEDYGNLLTRVSLCGYGCRYYPVDNINYELSRSVN